MYRVLVTSRMFGRISHGPIQRLKSIHCELVDSPYKGMTHSEDQMVEIIPNIDAVIIGADKISSKVLERANRLKVIAVHGVGVDQIDVDTATNKGISVTNAPGCNTQAVADFTFGLMISIARHIPKADLATKKGEWQSLMGTELFRKTLGIVGMGNIGKAVAKRALGFEMKTLAFDIYKDVEFAKKYNVEFVSLEELLRRSDFVTVHLSLTKETRGLIDREKMSRMKGSAYLINGSRGNIVDEESLFNILANKKIMGAAVDVYSQEPPQNLKWLNLPNVITTPHMAAFTYEAIDEASKISAENVARVLSGDEPLYPVNRIPIGSFKKYKENGSV